jgi:hypothetical protein
MFATEAFGITSHGLAILQHIQNAFKLKFISPLLFFLSKNMKNIQYLLSYCVLTRYRMLCSHSDSYEWDITPFSPYVNRRFGET